MRKLLSANLARLWRSKLFWALEIGSLLWSFIVFGLFIYNTKEMGEIFMVSHAHMYFFYVLLYIGAIIAVLTSLFLGTEYADGTIRNKLAVGHPRWSVYLSNFLVVCVAAIIFYGTHFLASAVCIPLIGTQMYAFLAQPMLCILYGIVIIVCFCAVFTLVAMLDSSKSRCAVVSLVLSLVLIVSGMMVYSNMTMEPTKEQMVLMEDGSYELQTVTNPRYLTGTKRVIFVCMDVCLPGSQAFRVASGETPDWKAAVCILGLSCAMTVGGITGFKKKDIK